MDLKIFIDVAADIRSSDACNETSGEGRSLESVADQYLSTVRPMHEQYVQPCAKHADIIIRRADAARKPSRLLSGYTRLSNGGTDETTE